MTPTGSKETITRQRGNVNWSTTQTANITTTFTTEQFEDLPSPGGDIHDLCFHRARRCSKHERFHGFSTGNFSSAGLPGISNLIILNGADQTDSFFNVSAAGGIHAQHRCVGNRSGVAGTERLQHGMGPSGGRGPNLRYEKRNQPHPWLVELHLQR